MISSLKGSTILFGGSFDPPHSGHCALAEAALARLPTAHLVFVPAYGSPGKPLPLATSHQRLRWLDLLCEENERWSVWDWELLRETPSFTVDTLSEAHRLGARKEDLYWLIGADAYKGRNHWREPQKISELCRFLVAGRPGHFLELAEGDLALPCPLMGVSSSALRTALAQGTDPRKIAELPPKLREEFQFQHPYASTEQR
jgi:nicotinate-nucleotide adenylyltransferase